MAERFITNGNGELEFTKKHIASISSLAVQYSREFALPPDERERKVPVVGVRSSSFKRYNIKVLMLLS